MDKLLGVQTKRGIKQAKPRKTPTKVVYISNPRKVKTSPSEFRSLVQELTGQDSDVTDDPKFSDINGGDALWSVPHRGAGVSDEPIIVRPVPSIDSVHREMPASVDSPFDDVFTSQMLENFTGFFPSGPSTLLYEAQVDHLLRSLDAV
eukprot:TRINITY_DN1938_c0_g2_i4.p1 TRINITY_DN1938_c0_g2~~TRINITY_DN1938_c0_g2_i4.p1  ORF type:complete len:148 (+),score=16.59 TRINITY_DN1938_c0_g2_i4:274-717(+)